MATYLVTGSAGFIGFHLSKKLLDEGHKIIGIDNLNNYYSVALKKDRLKILKKSKNFTFYKKDISDKNSVFKIFKKHAKEVEAIIHLAAQAGVRYSIENPFAYLQSNLVGQMVMLEAVRNFCPQVGFVYASSSSVYGANKKQPFSEKDRVDNPVSLYAATKKSGEMLVESYCRLYNIKALGLRFFTVYGQFGRPDMAYFSFTKNIIEGRQIKVFNKGEMWRDFTFVDDIISGIIGSVKFIGKQKSQKYFHKIYNLGNNKPEKLSDMISLLEKLIGKKANIKYEKMQAGDVLETYADISLAQKDFKFSPKTKLSEGLKKFIDWYKLYYI
jgi:UDP-glucuronate 4-epimerase